MISLETVEKGREVMPNISIEGSDIEDVDKKRVLVQELMDAATKAYGMPREEIVVLIKEFSPENVGLAGNLRIDRTKAKEIIGDLMCFWGNVPVQILISGTPQQVHDNVKELIDTLGDNGGLVIDGSTGIPKESKLEKVIAMTETVFEYGVY